MEATGVVLICLLAVVVSGFLARISGMPAPLLQIALGACIYYSSLASVVLDPDVFFLLFLPPLLFLDGWRIPKDALFRDAWPILKLALGLVVFTVLGMGFFIHWLIPSMPLAVAFALAAVISPTDPIAVSAIAARTPIPTRLMHILQGESLLNDASGLVCMRFAVAAVVTGSFSPSEAFASFLWIAAGGLAIGVAVTWIVARFAGWASIRLGQDGGAQILVTLLIPYGVYLLAERVQCSGILAAVAAGVTMSFTDVWPWRAVTRLRRTAVWDTVQLAANGSIFVLLGEQIPALITAAPKTVLSTAQQNPWWLVHYVLVIVGALIVLRFAWVWASLKLTFIRLRRRGGVAVSSSWRLVLATSLAGVRGAVTLAGVLTLPLTLGNGVPFPARDLCILLAAGVILVYLILATAGLPRTLRGIQLPPEPTQHEAEEVARRAAGEAALRAIASSRRSIVEDHGSGQRYAELAEMIAEHYRQRSSRALVDDASATRKDDKGLERQLWLVALRAEREEILQRGRDHVLQEMTVRKLVRELDHQEARYSS